MFFILYDNHVLDVRRWVCVSNVHMDERDVKLNHNHDAGYTKSVLKLMKAFLASGLGYTSVLHSVAAACEVSRPTWVVWHSYDLHKV